MQSPSPIFALPADASAPIDPTLIAADQEHIARIAASIRRSVTALTHRLTTLRHIRTGEWQEAFDRDIEIRDVQSRLAVLQRYERDSCLGRCVRRDGSIDYIGRVGLVDVDGEVLLIDWRAPEAAPFFGATHAHPADLESRRRYRWSNGSIVDFWDEVLTSEELTTPVAAEDDSAFLSSLAASRSPQMRDVLGTIATDQDVAIRASSLGALIVDGGPGTGKTVVALHRAAYLLYADNRLRGHRGGLLVVGPHEPYLAYVADVLPNLGTDGVRMCTPSDLVGDVTYTDSAPDRRIADLKGSLTMVDAIERAVRFYEQPPTSTTTVATPWAEITLAAADWAEGFDAAAGTPHNEARERIWETIAAIVADSLAARGVGDVTADTVSAALQADEELTSEVNRAWPILHATDIVGDLWTVPAFLRWCAPSLTADDVEALYRHDGAAWTSDDLPLLDAARRRLGDPDAEGRRRRRRRVLEAQRAEMDEVVTTMIAAHEYDDGEGLLPMLRQQDLRDVLVNEDEVGTAAADPFAGPFAHLIIDEAQELTDAQWRMLLDRCPSRSMTIVGDRAQARRGFVESWAERLTRVGIDTMSTVPLTVNYRTPAEIMDTAAPIIRAAIPDANIPTSIRRSGRPVQRLHLGEIDDYLTTWLDAHPDATACVIGDSTITDHDRVRSLTPQRVKGLEFDLVIVVRPDTWGTGITAAVDTYVGMTRATAQLVIAH